MLDAHLFLLISGTPADCASLGISGKLFDGLVPDLVSFGFYSWIITLFYGLMSVY
jgi:hypothetical protein